MKIRPQRDQDKPPSPGGDPDQPNADVPAPPATDQPAEKPKSGFGHIGNKDVPAPKGAPKPHQIF